MLMYLDRTGLVFLTNWPAKIVEIRYVDVYLHILPRYVFTCIVNNSERLTNHTGTQNIHIKGD